MAFAFLVGAGFTVTFDSDRLSPHESGSYCLRYEKGNRVVEIAGDVRDSDWAVSVDGRQLGASFYAYQPEIASRVAQVQAIL